MPIRHYGVLKCQALEGKLGQGSTPHYQVLVVENDVNYRLAINVKSQASPSELLYYIDENLQDEMLTGLQKLDFGYTLLPSHSSGQEDHNPLALDYVRGGLFDTKSMVPMPYQKDGENNDLNELLDRVITQAIQDKNAVIYAFGEKWGPENKADKYFHFQPGNGVHDMHMNQGNSSRWRSDDGPWQDGGLLIHFAKENRWTGIFLAFQSQSFYTDDRTGHQIEA